MDLIAEAQHEQYEVALNAMLKQHNMHSALVILTPTAFTNVEKIAKSIIKVSKRIKKPVLSCLLGLYDVSKGIDLLEEKGLPPKELVQSLLLTSSCGLGTLAEEEAESALRELKELGRLVRDKL